MRSRVIVVGLTGSIGMGKSLVTSQFAALGAKVCNADAIVHRLLGKDGAAVAEVAKHFPGAVEGGIVDRRALGQMIFGDEKKRLLLESILHPLVVALENRFIYKEGRMGAKIIVLDIPLLFETGGEKRCDVTVCTTAPAFLQAQRVMRRPHMTAEKFAAILRLQWPDRAKRRRADIVINTGLGRAYSFRAVARLMGKLYAA